VCLQGSASCISKEDTLQTQRLFWEGSQKYNVVSFVVSSCIVAALVVYFAGVRPHMQIGSTYTQHVVYSSCVHPVALETVSSRKLSTLATHVQHSATGLEVVPLASEQHIRQSDANLNVPYTSQRCISGNVSQSSQNRDTARKTSIAANAPVVPAVSDRPDTSVRQATPVTHSVPHQSTIPSQLLLPASQEDLGVEGGSIPLSASMLQGSADNIFPSGQCTWWANQRYHQLHDIFVPWRTNANAFQWVSRALESGWHVSGTPNVGSIMVLQPYVDGAYGLGHVGVVEQILTDDRVVSSSINWGQYPSMVTLSTFVLGPGVSFVSNY
jgi:surface antigen